MRLPKFEYLEPRTLKEAIKTLVLEPGGSVLLAGGTDLLVNMKHRVVQPTRIVNLKSIPRMASLSSGKDGLKIGPLTTLHDLAVSPAVKEKYPALSHAATEVGAYVHQGMATLGGNLCQATRCRLYNQSEFWRSVRPPCYKAGGKNCYVVRKQGECHSTYCGDLAPVLIALDSRIVIAGPGGERTILLKKLYNGNGKRPLSLKKGELLKEVLVPSPSGESVYLKWRLRGSLEFPIVSVALCAAFSEDRRIEKARIVFSGVGPGPVEGLQAEKLLEGNPMSESLIEKVSTGAVKEISPMRTSVTSPAYKKKMAGILLRQALEEIQKSRS
jgi:4-hydroxybenzoyl-CoA reductase subunit beta